MAFKRCLPAARMYSTPPPEEAEPLPTLKRSYLYVPASLDRMLAKSLSTPSDVIIYDLEDSVPPSVHDKDSARSRLGIFLRKGAEELPSPDKIAVRVNSVTTPFFNEDLLQALQADAVRTLILPKIHSAQDLNVVSRQIYSHLQSTSPSVNTQRVKPIQLVASIESAQSLYHLGEIAGWQSEFGPLLGGKLVALLFAAEDYCADTSIIRTPQRTELLYTRSKIAITAKAFGLEAIDMVCVNYKDLDYLKDECLDGRRLGFTGKQAIHPAQVEIIQSTFVPSEKEILRAARILLQMERAHKEQRGAAGLTTEDGGKEMIDAPMIKQAENTIRNAMAAGLPIPKAEE
ncbi:hypothetical protein NM688_g318 [Phlebia brevispora]|uniref:Uncharacterized protein n=1 Tax=Phlebia brevispora TaxID=194682 RepID=A0ACC1TFF5_9APHY|nr:hypothetical protein NM688_g318 [Phlebia brevispora]